MTLYPYQMLVLKILGGSKTPLSPTEIMKESKKLQDKDFPSGLAYGTVRNALVELKRFGYAENICFGSWILTKKGKKMLSRS